MVARSREVQDRTDTMSVDELVAMMTPASLPKIADYGFEVLGSPSAPRSLMSTLSFSTSTACKLARSCLSVIHSHYRAECFGDGN